MPKRAKCHVLSTGKRRKSMLIDDSSQSPGNLDATEDDQTRESSCFKPAKSMRYSKNNQKQETERLLRYHSTNLLISVDHSDLPAFNTSIWPQENTSMLTCFPSSSFSAPRPIYVAGQHCESTDICFKRPMERYMFKNGLRFTKTVYHTALKSNKNLRKSLNSGIYHNAVFDIAERVYRQPDTYFQGSYDYYYTGGNLCIIPHQRTVIHTGGETLQEIIASEFPVVNEYSSIDCIRKIASLKKSEGSEIFELHPLVTSLKNTRRNCFISRQKNLICFNYLSDNNQLKTLTQFRTKSTPFISFAQSNHAIDNFIITTMKQHIRLYDLAASAPQLVNLYEISPERPNISWNSVKPWRENTFLYANEKQFFMIDIRTSPDQWLNEVLLTTDNLICDHMSAILPSGFNNLFYIATNHKLLCMDIRYLKKFSANDSEGAICRWSHQLRYAPLMMDAFRLRQTEYIAMSSPIAGDLHICQLSRERNEDDTCLDSSLPTHKHVYNSGCLAYQPPTLHEAYENARLSGKCLNPKANMEARLKFCTTGMKFFSSPTADCGIGLLLISNSIGDVFAHTMSKREDNEAEKRCNEQSAEIMSEFEQRMCEQAKTSLKYTKIKNMKGLRKVFLCEPLSEVKKFCFDTMDNEYDEDATQPNNTTNPQERKRSKRLHMGRWQKSLSTLHSYKDALVPNLLSIWDIDIDEEKNIHLGNLQHKVKPDPALLVENWLKSNINPDPHPVLSMPFERVASYLRNGSSNILDSTFNINQTQTTVDFANVVHSTQMLDDSVINTSNNFNTCNTLSQINNDMATGLESVKTKKKNKKYVKGF